MLVGSILLGGVCVTRQSYKDLPYPNIPRTITTIDIPSNRGIIGISIARAYSHMCVAAYSNKVTHVYIDVINVVLRWICALVIPLKHFNTHCITSFYRETERERSECEQEKSWKEMKWIKSHIYSIATAK